MSKRFLARAMAGTLTVTLLLVGLCGCGKNPDTPTPTDATTTASDTTTTAPEETTALQTDETTTPDTSATDAPTAEPTSEPTPAFQIGGDKVVLDGEVFTLGGSPDALFAHFGKPNKVQDSIDPSCSGDVHFYYYDNVIIETHSFTLKNGEKPEVVRGIGFPNDHYSFDGVTVGMTAAEVNAKIGSRVEGRTHYARFYEGIYAGLYRVYPAPHDDEKNTTRWLIFYTDPNGELDEDKLRGEDDKYALPNDYKVESIEVRHKIDEFFDKYRGQWVEK